jgi:hypothetical protein
VQQGASSETDPPTGIQRILIYGVTGSGKTTLARQIGARTGLLWHSVDDQRRRMHRWAADPSASAIVLLRSPHQTQHWLDTLNPGSGSAPAPRAPSNHHRFNEAGHAPYDPIPQRALAHRNVALIPVRTRNNAYLLRYFILKKS